ncbi:hypothetical protein DVK85_01375 [Flavobacterium arcticum]|uniref:Uncharacterized protein n=1 Tax=Flavobacterium arcticum TaxID=1784713 RepID=A0A345H8P3_9FLAO|nr:hypothetical protein [Flavobacterium arcticum]AXG72953.1 hypothetical protein DVK85_01375 [Flavobacterium arcticum]KAF2510383.1 hypothetical protein E0W72_07830 [Flavobacterium arcticum]
MNDQETLQKLPYCVTKSQLMYLYRNDLTDSDIRKGINTIIADNRKLPNDKPVCVKRVRHTEFIEFVEIYGLPEGYKL